MSDPLADDELTAYAAGRWPVVVRTLVLLGAPPPHAAALATQALARLFARCAEDDWIDLDAALAAETVEGWEDDRTAWWRHPSLRDDASLAGSGASEACAVLDAMPPGERARLVVAVTAGLSEQQLDDVLGPAAPSPLGQAWRDDLARVAAAVPVGEPRIAQARAEHVDRRQHGRGLALAGLVAGLLVVALVVTLGLGAVDPQPAADAPTATPTASRSAPAEPVRREPDLLPVPWYDGRRVHLADRIVTAPRLRSTARLGDGVVGVEAGGRVVLVRGVGGVERLGVTGRGARVVSDPGSGTAAWVDAPTGRLALARLDGAVSFAALSPDSRVLALDRRQVFVESPAGARRVLLDGLRSTRALSGLLDAASGTQVRRVDDETLRVEIGPTLTWTLPGRDGWLSDDGTYLVTRDVTSGAAPPDVVVDVRSRTTVELPLPASSVVVDAAFSTLSDLVTFVLVRANGTEYPADWPRDGDYQPGYDLVVCDLSERSCQRDAMLFGAEVAPVLAR